MKPWLRSFPVNKIENPDKNDNLLNIESTATWLNLPLKFQLDDHNYILIVFCDYKWLYCSYGSTPVFRICGHGLIF